MRSGILLCVITMIVMGGAVADQHFIYFEAEQATESVHTAFRDQGFTTWMGHPSGGRTVIFAGSDGVLRFSLDALPEGGEYWVHVRHLALSQARVEVFVGEVSLGVTEFPQPGVYLGWSKPLGPLFKEDGNMLSIRPAEGNSQAPYIDVVLITDKKDFIPDNVDQDFATLVLRTNDKTLRFSGHSVGVVAGKTAVDLRAENTTNAPVTADFVVTVTDPVLQTRRQERRSLTLASGATETLHLPYAAETGYQYTVRTEVLDNEGAALFFDTTGVRVVEPVAFGIDARVLSPGESAVITLTVNDPDLRGKEARFLLVRDGAPPESLPVRGTTVEARVAADDLDEGDHRLRALYAGDTVHEAEFALSVISWPKDPLPDIERVTIEGQTILVNGKPFVPRKLHHANGSAMLKRQGFNAVDCWGGDSLDGVEEMLDEAHAANLYGFGILFHGFFYKGRAEGFDLEAIREGVARLKDHPALLLWELYDEPDAGVPVDHLLKAYLLLRELDPNHPVLLNFCFPDKFREYAVAADIVSMDTYPIPSLPVTTISDYMDALGASVDHQKPLQVVLQTYGSVKGRMPTPEELRCMTYLAINHGARSTAFYSYAEGKDYPYCLNADPLLWSYVRKINAELLAIMPAMAAPGFAGKVTAANGNVDAAARMEKDGILLVCVNTSNEAVESTISVEGTWPGVTPVFDSPPPSVHETNNGTTRITTTFAPLGVHLYRFRE